MSSPAETSADTDETATGAPGDTDDRDTAGRDGATGGDTAGRNAATGSAAETIEWSGARLGGHAWLAMRLFETLGRWSGTADDPRAAVLFGSMSRRQGRHAELWLGLLPALPHLPTGDLLAPTGGADAVVTSLGRLDDAPASTRLAALTSEAMPHVVGRYREHLDVAVPLTDGPTIRVLRLALADLDDDVAASATLARRRDVDHGD